MTRKLVDKVADAVLYEGYILYPYRPSVKNRQRWSFGGLYPKAYHDANGGYDPWTMQSQTLVETKPTPCAASTAALSTSTVNLPAVNVRVRFLHLINRTVGKLNQPLGAWPLPRDAEPDYTTVEMLEVSGERYQAWQEATQRQVTLSSIDDDQTSVNHPGPSISHRAASASHAAFEVSGTEQTHRQIHFSFPASHSLEPLRNEEGQVVGLLIRDQQPIHASVELITEPLEPGLHRLTARLRNETDLEHAHTAHRDDALMRSLVSTHFVLELDSAAQTTPIDTDPDQAGPRGPGGGFVSLIDPPPRWQAHARACDNQGCWPVLVGEEPDAEAHPQKRSFDQADISDDTPGTDDLDAAVSDHPPRHTMLGSPIILYDYPQIASESPGELFDSTEIDEILSLRVMTLTDEEKREAAANDDHAKALLERTESLARDQLMNLHGQMKRVGGGQNLNPEISSNQHNPESKDQRPNPADPRAQSVSQVDSVHVGERELSVGDQVRLNPRGNADVFDVVLKGLTATIEKIEQDLENRTHLAVTIDDDPGADFGREGKPGHRFFFEPADVEPITRQSEV